jgi:hypothetical protein
MTDIRADPKKYLALAALFKHWNIADSVKQVVTAELPDEATTASLVMSEGSVELDKAHSAFMRLSVWYSLLYVVVEGYQELNLEDAAVDTLLAKEELVQMLRRFRNAMFHYQENPLSDKLLEFLVAKESTTWPVQLNNALYTYFERVLPIHEMLEKFKREEE